MHIALISPGWPLGYPNGIVTYVHHLREGLLQAGHQVSVLCFNGVEEGAWPDVHPIRASTVRRLGQRVQRLWGASADGRDSAPNAIIDTLQRIHRQRPIDVVEMEESFGWCAQVQAAFAAPVVVKLHGPAFLSLMDEEREGPAAAQRLQREGDAVARARAVTSPSTDTLLRTRRHYGLPADLGRVVANPMVPPPSLPQWRREACDPEHLLFVGRFDKRKGGDLVVRAMGELLRQRPTLRMTFVGPDRGVVQADGQVMTIEQACSAWLPVESRQRLTYTGPLSPERIAPLRCEAAVTLVASRWDNQPGTALEALMQGCPLVAFDTGGMAEIVEHEVSGLLAPADDIDALVAQVLRQLDDLDQAGRWAQQGRARVLRRHDLQLVTAQTLAVYADVLAARPA